MNILICDDIEEEGDNLNNLIAESGLEVNTVVFNKASEALRFVRSRGMVDVCFLDILMPDMTGVELAACLRADGYKGRIVFLSTSREYGPEAVRVKAFSYLLKPPTQESVGEVLRELDDALKESDTGGILIRSVGASRLVLFQKISHAEVIKHTVYFRLTDGSVIETSTSATFAEIAPQLLAERRFVQCHRSYIVNMDAISAVHGNNFAMRGGEIISISRSYSEAKERYLEWVLEGDE